MYLLLRILLSILNIICMIQTWILSIVPCKKPSSIPPITDSFYMLSTATVAKKIREKKITSYEVVTAYIERIKVVNPVINAIIDNRFAAALNEAKMCDEQLRCGEYDVETLEREKPLFGVPFSVKETIPVKGLSHTTGILARTGMKATVDNEIVRLLRDAGAIPLCVTNVPEACAGLNSVNPLFGRVCNIYDTRFTAGGSSGGEGALVGAGASSFGIGSDLGGSVRIPASFNGVFGCKFTSGIVPNGEHFPDSKERNFQRFLGMSPLTRRAEDLALIAKVLTSRCDRDLRLDVPVDFTQLKVYYRLGMETFGMMPLAPEIERCILRAANYFARYNVRAEELPIEWSSNMIEIMLTSFQDMSSPRFLYDVDPELRKNPLIEMMKAFIGRSHHNKISICFETFRIWPFFTSAQISYYTQQRETIRQQLLDLLGDNGVFIYPNFRIPPSHPNLMAYELWNSLVYPAVANIFGFPAVHVPMGLNQDGLPVGVAVIAAAHQDRLCLAVAKELEKAFGGWTPPSTSIRD